MFKNVSYFALLKNEKKEVVIKRIKLERQAQESLTKMFIKTAESLLKLDRINFDGNYKPDEGEIHQIGNFSLPDEIVSALKEPTSIDELKLTSENTSHIYAIFTGTSDPTLVVFQKFNSSQYITSKGISLFHSNDTFQLLSSFGINILDRIDCIYGHNSLLFNSFFMARQIFDLSEYYREATESDVDEFVKNPKIHVEDSSEFYSQADSWVRRKIALIKDSQALEKFSPKKICEKAATYGVHLNTKREGREEKLVLPKEKKEMKDALRFLDEEIYRGPLTETTYLTNSKRKYG